MSQPTESAWIVQLKAGGEQAANRLWEQYFQRLVGLARLKLAGVQGREDAAEDVALSAFKSLCLGARRGSFTDLHSGDNLWPLLLFITSRKASKLKAREGRQKRGGGKSRGESVFEQLLSESSTDNGLQEIQDRAGHPEHWFTIEVKERLGALDQQLLQMIALRRLEGFSNQEIAAELQISLRAVERKLQIIREKWDSTKS